MFKAMPMGSTIAVDRRYTTQLHRSANGTRVGYGAGPMQMARAFVLVVHAPGSHARVFAYLGLVERGASGEPQGLLFRAEPEEVPEAHVPGLVAEALQLVTAQGFHMEDTQIRSLGEPERGLLLADLPFDLAALAAAPIGGVGAPPPVAPLAPAPGVMDVASDATPIDVSGQMSLPGRIAVQAIGRILTLF